MGAQHGQGGGRGWLLRAAWGVAIAAIPLSLVTAGATVSMALVAVYGIIAIWRGERLGEELSQAALFTIACYLTLLTVDILNGGGLANFYTTGVNYLHLVAVAPFALALSLLDIRMSAVERALQAAILLGLANSLVLFLVYGISRPGGPGLNSIPYSFVLAMWGTFLLARGLQAGRTGALSIAIAGAAFVPVLLGESRIVWACMLAGYGTVIVVISLRQGRHGLLVRGAAAMAFVAGAAYYLFAFHRIGLMQRAVEAYVERGQVGADSFGYRFEALRSAWRAAMERPWLGHGFDERLEIVFAHRDPNGPDILFLGHLHNDYMTHLVAYGVPGFLFVLAFLAFLVVLSRRAPDMAGQASALALAAMLAVYMTAEVAFNMDPISGAVTIALGVLLLRERPLRPGGGEDEGAKTAA